MNTSADAAEPIICTIVAKNYLAHARCLAQSFKRYHPSGRVYVLLVDELGNYDSAGESFELVPVSRLGIAELPGMIERYDIRELCTAVKPFFLRYLFEQHELNKVCYFDPDIYFYGPIADIWQALDTHQAVVTPHLLGPLDEQHVPNEWWILRGGTYNLGFLGLARDEAVDRFLVWWQSRLIRYAHCRPEQFQHFDQKWIDLLPGFLPRVLIDRHPGHNTAYWDLANRRLVSSSNTHLINGQPLTFFHFSGYQVEHPDQISKHQDRYTFDDLPDLRRLCDDYRAALLEAGYAKVKDWPFELTVSPPKESGQTFFVGGRVLGAAVYNRLASFARMWGVDAFIINLLGERTIMAIRRRLWGSATPALPPTHDRPFGISVIGYFGHETGVGQGSRTLLWALADTGIPTSYLPADTVRERPDPPWLKVLPKGEARSVVMVDANPDTAEELSQRYARELAGASAVVGFWRWELETMPARWAGQLSSLAELWVPSEFTRQAVAPHSNIPIIPIGLPVVPGEVPRLSRQQLGLPGNRFIYLFVVDLGHYPERKNIAGVVAAFRRAFGSKPGLPLLVIKTLHGERNPRYLAQVKALVSSVDGLVLDGWLSRPQLNALYALSDAYVSLHHAEGFGLTIAEAMYFGKPTVATNYSGSTDFLNAGNGFPVGYELTEIGHDIGPYPADALWAAPHTDEAAHWLRYIFEEPLEAVARAQRASQTIQAAYSSAAIGQHAAARVRRLGKRDPVKPPLSVQPSFAELLNTYGAAHSDSYFVQVGAADGITGDPLYTYVRRFGWSGLLIEPDPANFARLRRDYRSAGKLHFANVAIAQESGSQSMYRLDPAAAARLPWWHDQLISFSEDVVRSSERWIPDAQRYLTTEQVQCETLAKVLAQHQVSRIDVLLIDVEGYDWQLLQQFDFKRYRPAIIRYEHWHLSEQDQLRCIAHLERRGYRISSEGLDTIAYLPDAMRVS